MKRLYVLTLTMLLTFLWLAPAVLGANPTPATTASNRVLISTAGGLTLPAGEQADVVVVTRGTATIGGTVGTLVVIDGAAELTGAQVVTIFAVHSPVTLGPGTVVSGDIRTVDSTVTQTGDAQIQGTIRDVSIDLVGLGLILAPAILLLVLGFFLAAIAAGLLLAALGARQVRTAEGLISHEPGHTLLWGIGGIFVPGLVAILLMITVVGAPLGLGILFFLWPVTAFLGYLVAAIWIGDWILHRTSPTVVRERPYLAAVIGLVVLMVLSILPFFTAIASLFGYGAVLLLAWRTFHQGGIGEPTEAHPAVPASPVPPASAAPMAS